MNKKASLKHTANEKHEKNNPNIFVIPLELFIHHLAQNKKLCLSVVLSLDGVMSFGMKGNGEGGIEGGMETLAYSHQMIRSCRGRQLSVERYGGEIGGIKCGLASLLSYC
jgi:hypothetical protein